MIVRKKTLLFTGSITAVILIFCSYYMMDKGYIRFNYPSEKKFPVRGIDISHHQNIIDWEKVKRENLAFVFIKATEGGDFIDPLFSENVSGAQKIGLAAGAYHFFTFCRDGKTQAENFMRRVADHHLNLPPVIDLEYGGNCKKRLSKPDLFKALDAFTKEIQKQLPQPPILYVTYEFYNDYFLNQPLPYDIWIRDIFNHPNIKDKKSWLFWQYSNRGRIDGIGTPVDLNVFSGTQKDFEALIQ